LTFDWDEYTVNRLVTAAVVAPRRAGHLQKQRIWNIPFRPASASFLEIQYLKPAFLADIKHCLAAHSCRQRGERR
jgi:hypothetical protein